MQLQKDATSRTEQLREGGLIGGHSSSACAGDFSDDQQTDADAQETARQAEPDDLGGTSLDSGLTAGGTDTSIDPVVVSERIVGEVDAGPDAGVSEDGDLGMGTDDRSGYFNDIEGEYQA